MALFGFGKRMKDEEQKGCCCGMTIGEVEEEASCGYGSTAEAENECYSDVKDGICCIKVLGAGCKSCHEQFENAKITMKKMGLDIEVEYITDMEKVMAYGVMSMPALVVNEKVVSMGKVLKPADLEKLLHDFS
ncbi:MAG: thioredoxin family protein [Lachnospiraceae bacterium]|nr:thioredoxin family protein [Lachnospiraceae bacterium]